MLQGKTKSGFEYDLNEDILDDWDFLELLRIVDKGDISLIVDVAQMILGNEQYEKLKNHLRKDGKLKMTVMSEEIGEIMKGPHIKN